jgi:hypothetical protein
MKNTLAGTKKGNSRSAKFYHENREAAKKKADYDKKYHATEERKQYRAELNKANRSAGTYGKMSEMGKDRSHTKDGKLVLESSSRNRARNGSGKGSTKK